MKTHLKYRNIDRRVLDATETLFAQAPWRMDSDEEAVRIGQDWLNTVSGVYRVACPVLHVDSDVPYPYDLEPGTYTEDVDGIPNSVAAPTISLTKWSITNLFGAFRAYCLAVGVATARDGSPHGIDSDIWEWATSLFYAVKPVMFRARCREGRIFVTNPVDTFGRDTLAQLESVGLLAELERNGASRQWRDKVDAFMRGEPVGEDAPEAPQSAQEARPGVDPVPTGDYGDLDVTALRRLASERDIARAWRNTKDENIAALREQDRQHTQERFENDVPAEGQVGT